MCKLYGIQSLLDLKVKSKFMSGLSVVKDIKFRLIHLRSRQNSFQFRAKQDNRSDQRLFNDVKDLCTKLEDQAKHIEDIDEEIENRGVITNYCLEQYKADMKNFDCICELLIKNIEELTAGGDNILTRIPAARREHLKQKYSMNNLDQLSSNHNIQAIDSILEDVLSRKQSLSPLLAVFTRSIENTPFEQNLVLNHILNQAKQKCEFLCTIERQLIDLRNSLTTIEQYIEQYDQLLRDDQFQDIPCSKFILLMERLRVRTEKLELARSFPLVNNLMDKWQNDYGKASEFNPRIIDLFIALEMDVQTLLSSQNGIYMLPYKTGVIGDGAVGKSALIMHLAEQNEFISMVDIERSTFGYLAFDTLIYKHPLDGKLLPIIFIDIEGATDVADTEFIGCYNELINKADCDMYIIAFDKAFNDRNRKWQKHIEKTLGRKCFLVRTKADLVFKEFHQQLLNGRSETRATNQNFKLAVALEKTRDHSITTFDDDRLRKEAVYITAVGCKDDSLKDKPFLKFDLNKLKDDLVQLVIEDFRGERVRNRAALAARTIINICFRRCYLLSKMFYKLLAAGVSIIPFVDELVSFTARQELHEAIGVQDDLATTHKLSGTKDSFEKYLMEKNFRLPKNALKSGYFKYLIWKETEYTTTTTTTITSDVNIDQHAARRPTVHVVNRLNTTSSTSRSAIRVADIFTRSTTVGGAALKVGADALRFIGPSASAAVQFASITAIVVGAVLTPVFAAWSYYSTGKRMNEHLHRLCDDLVTIVEHFIYHMCNESNNNNERLSQPLAPSDE